MFYSSRPFNPIIAKSLLLSHLERKFQYSCFLIDRSLWHLRFVVLAVYIPRFNFSISLRLVGSQIKVVNMASADADLPSQPKYDVFLSFRGPDTRQKFTSHLYEALCRKKIYTYIDDEALDRGDEIGPALLTAIRQSKLSIVIFSKDYASSRWCLDELVHILKCKKEHGLLVVPVFYEINPSDVRKQQGSYADSFAILEERFKHNMDKVCVWSGALSAAADLSGFDWQNIGHEAEFVKTIVNHVLIKLNRNWSYDLEKGLVGMERHIQQIELLLSIHTQDVCFRAIGIWGMGGIGKTTLADAVFHLNSSQFDASLFLANVREESEKHGLNHLRNELLGRLLKEENLSIGSPSIGSSYIIDRLSRTKVLIVLDDVSDLKQLESLLGDRVQFGPGSRVIITTRNRRLLKKIVHEDHIYKMNELSVHEAVQLFQSIVFDDESSRTDYSDLSRRVVEFVGCIPLALKVSASSFLHCNNNKEDWEEELNKLKKYPNTEVQNVLRYSFDGLKENEQGIFLDIACFLNLENICYAKRMLEMHGFYASGGVKVLIDMSLISIRVDRIEMHDLLQEMGRAIERGFEDLGKRKRYWNAEDAYRVLKTNTGTSTVEAIFLDISKTGQLQLSPNSFRDMHNLSLLKIFVSQEVHEERAKRRRCFEEKQLIPFSSLPRFNTVQHFLAESRIWSFLRSSALCKSFFVYTGREEVIDDEFERKYLKVYIPGGLESLPHQLKYLYWDRYPLKSLPSKYFPESLVELHMPNSRVRKLWNHVQILDNLKVMNLRHSENLTEVPDLSKSPNIEIIDLRGCTSLVEVPSYFENLDKLRDLDMRRCRNLKTLSEIPCNIEALDLSETAIEEIPPSIWSRKKLRELFFVGCRELKHLQSSSSSINTCTLNLNGGGDQNLSGLEELFFSNCTRLESVPDSIYNSNRLKSLVFMGCLKLKRWPPLSSAEHLCHLTWLSFSECKELEEIPESLLGLSSLEQIDLSVTSIERIPESIINASGLRSLCLQNCTKLQYLPELPRQLNLLDAGGCTSLKSMASSKTSIIMPWTDHDRFGEELLFDHCLQLDASSRSNIMLDVQLRILRQHAPSTKRHPYRQYPREENATLFAAWPGNEIPKWFDNQSEGCSINLKFSPPRSSEEEDQDNFLGFALSAVVTGPHQRNHLFCNLNLKTDDGKSHVYDFSKQWSSFLGDELNSEGDHVLVFYENKFSGVYSYSIPPMNKITEASFDFRREQPEYVKKCGVRLLYNRDLGLPHL